MKTEAQKRAIARRPKLRPATKRMLEAQHLFFDERRQRFVIHRRAGGVTRKTSVRTAAACGPVFRAQEHRARRLARRLHGWPGARLAEFTW